MSATIGVRASLVPAQELQFGPLRIAYDQRVLEPRAWTVQQSEWAADLLTSAPAGPVLELCSGAGQIGLLTAHLSGRPLVMVDLSGPACDYARLNADRAQLPVDIRNERMEHAVDCDERFALVIADPPWVPTAETGRFPLDPRTSIDGGLDGLRIARTCLMVITAQLLDSGYALLQVGTEAQADLLGDDLPRFGLARVGQRTYGDRGVVIQLARAPRD